MGIEFQFCKMKRVLEMDGGVGYPAWIYLTLPNCILKNDQGGKFYVMCI